MNPHDKKIIKEEIRKVIESYGVNYETNTIAKILSKKVWNLILSKTNNGSRKVKPYDKSMFIDHDFSKEEQKNHNISFINIQIYPLENMKIKEPNKVSGRFEVNSTKQHLFNNSFVYDLYFEVKIYNWDNKTNLSDTIYNVLTHELLHAFREIKTYNKNNYSKALYKARNNSKGLNISNNVKELNEFLEIFYLSLPEEVSARVHEAYSQMENYKMRFENKTSDEMIKELNKLSVFRDFVKVQEFNENIVLNLSERVKTDFVNNFNNQLKNAKNIFRNKSIKILSDPNSFFNFWIKNAKKESLIARHKIVSQAINLFDGKKQISEYKNNSYRNYSEQFYSEIMENLNSSSLLIVYDFFKNSYPIEENFLFLEEIKKYS